MKNKCGKTRDVENPYEIWENEGAGWTWHVLKKYQRPDKEGPHSRWFCAVKSPYTYGSYEMGDVYAQEVREHAVRVK